MKTTDELKIRLIYTGNLLFITLSPGPFAMILVYTYNLIRPGFTFSGTDWAAYAMSIAYIGLTGSYYAWSGKKVRQIRARYADMGSKSDVTEIRRKSR